MRYPKPTIDPPSKDALFADLERSVMDTGSPAFETSDGCEVESDGVCQHGHPTWLRRVGWI